MAHRVFITGASGYIGAMLVREYSKRDDVEAILALDREEASDLYTGDPKVLFIKANLSDEDWKEEVVRFAPDTVIHAAWQIREMYGKKKLQWKWNIDGSDNIFDIAFTLPSVKKLIHFSTVASYGAYSSNTIEHRFTEDEGFRKTNYLYAEEKRIAEQHLAARYGAAKQEGKNLPQVFIVRPASITGPRGRYMKVKFGLQSALSGQLKDSFLHKTVSKLLSFVPITPKWCRQFVHEDDIADAVAHLAFNDVSGEYEAFNLCPEGPVVTGPDMAKAVGKKPIVIHPWLIRIVFFLAWHLSGGKVPTSTGGWKSYSYPIAVDGSKITKKYGYAYKFGPKDAFTKKEGRYMEFVSNR